MFNILLNCWPHCCLTKNLPKYKFGRNATFKKQAKTLNNKALAAFAEYCLSLRSKRVPQELQVPNLFDSEPLSFLLSRQLVPS